MFETSFKNKANIVVISKTDKQTFQFIILVIFGADVAQQTRACSIFKYDACAETNISQNCERDATTHVSW